MSTQRVRDGMYESQIGVGKTEACDNASKHHLLSCFHVISVSDDLLHVLIQDLQTLQRIISGQRSRHVGDIALHRVGDGIHTRSGCHAGRSSPCEFRIGDHIRGSDLIIDHNILDDLLRVDQGADVGDLTGGSCRGRDRDQGQAGVLHHADAAVFPDRSGIGHQNVDGLRGIDAASAADCHKTVHLLLFRKSGRGLYDLIGGVRDHTVKDHVRDFSFLHFCENFFSDACSLDAAVIDDHDLLQIMFPDQFRKDRS